jgi:hypothetical protein
MVDSLAYEYSRENRQSRITFRKMLVEKPDSAEAPGTGEEHGHN